MVFPAPLGRSRAAGGPRRCTSGGPGSLPSIECGAVRRHLEQGQIHRRLLDSRTAATSGCRDETGLGVEDPLRGVQVGAGHGVDRGPVDPPQRIRFLDVVSRCDEGNGAAIEHLVDEQVHQALARSRAGRWCGPCCASARTCHSPGRAACSMTATTRLAVCATQRASTIVAVSAGGASAVRTIEATASELPSTAAASLYQVARCSARDRACVWRRGSLTSPAGPGATLRPVSAGGHDHAGTWMASSPRRASMWARRVDQRWFSRGSTPTISWIGRFVGSVPGRSANRTPNVSRRCCSSAVL